MIIRSRFTVCASSYIPLRSPSRNRDWKASSRTPVPVRLHSGVAPPSVGRSVVAAIRRPIWTGSERTKVKRLRRTRIATGCVRTPGGRSEDGTACLHWSWGNGYIDAVGQYRRATCGTGTAGFSAIVAGICGGARGVPWAAGVANSAIGAHLSDRTWGKVDRNSRAGEW